MKHDNIIKACIVLALILIYYAFLFHKISMTTDDLGRHLANGKIVFEDAKVLFSNYYSLAYPDYNTVNHHWLSGVAFYLLYSIGGFDMLVIFKIAVLLAAFLIMFHIASSRSTFWIASFVALPVIFVLAERTDVRPEIFSYLLTAVFLHILFNYENGKKSVWLLPFLQALWINMHIYFFLGLLILFLFAVQNFIEKKTEKARELALVLAASGFASILNPNGLSGALLPLFIFGNYGYPLAENQTPFFMYALTDDVSIISYFFILVLSAATFLFTLKKQAFAEAALSVFSVASGMFALRNITLFAFLALPLMSRNIHHLNLGRKYLAALAIIFIAVPAAISAKYPLFLKEAGLGLTAQSTDAAYFFNNQNITGSIFNNYDIGSYIIFYHFPETRPFVDNRPEAYPAGFFNKTYMPMQLDENEWKKNLEKFNFSAIYFSHQEGTYWGRGFLKRRMNDDEWGAVYAGRYAVILVRNDSPLYGNRITSENAQERLSYLINSSDSETAKAGADLLGLFGRYDLAISVYLRILDKIPDDTESLISLASIFSSSKESFALSAVYYEKAIAAGFSKPRVFDELGLVYFNMGEYGKAEESWNSALMLNSFDETARNYLIQMEEFRKNGTIEY